MQLQARPAAVRAALRPLALGAKGGIATSAEISGRNTLAILGDSR